MSKKSSSENHDKEVNAINNHNSASEISLTFDLNKVLLPATIFLSTLMFSLILAASLNTGFDKLSESIKNTASNIQTSTDKVAAENNQDRTYEISASVDDDPYLGNADASLAIVEFAAYDCPFCQRHAQQTLPRLLEEYISVGKVRYVFRDSPLAGGGQNYQANVANCARSEAGGSNEVYFKFHDLIYQNFEDFRDPNAREKVNAEITTLAQSLGLNSESIITCATNGDFSAEINKDIQDFSSVAASMGLQGLGVPTFVIGNLNADGTIKTTAVINGQTGEIGGGIINGAYPFETFKAVLDSLLQ